MAKLNLGNIAGNIFDSFKRASGISTLENIAGGVKKVANIVFEDQNDEIVNQTSRFSVPQFTTQKTVKADEPFSTKLYNALEKTTLSIGKTALSSLAPIPLKPVISTLIPDDIPKNMEKVAGTLGKSIVFNSLGIAESTPEFLSTSIKLNIEREKTVRAEASRIADERERLKYLTENDVTPLGIGYDTREWTANKLQEVSDWATMVKEKNKDLYPDIKFSEQPLSQNIKDPEFWANGIGGVIPSIISGIAVGVGTAYVTRNPTAVGLALFGQSYSIEGGAGYQQAKDFGLSDEDSVKAGNMVGIVNSVLESILPNEIVGNATKPIKDSIIKKTIRATITNPTLFNMGTEALTETAQEFWSNIVRSSYDENAKLTDNLLESLLFGGVGGLAGSAIGKAVPPIQMKSGALGLSMEDITKDPEKAQEMLRSYDETIDDHPAAPLSKYANKNQELPEVIGEGGKFGKTGDQIVTELGSSEEARESYASLIKLKNERNELKIMISKASKKVEAQPVIKQTPELTPELTPEEMSKLFDFSPIKEDIETKGFITEEPVTEPGQPVKKTTISQEDIKKKSIAYANKIQRDVQSLGGIRSETILQDMNEVGGYSFSSTDDIREAILIANKIFPTKGAITVSQKELNKRIMAIEKEQKRLLSKAETDAMAKVKGKKPTVKKIVKSETSLLKERIKSEARGSRWGYKAGVIEERRHITNELKNRFEEDISEIERTQELEKIKRGILTRHQQSIKDRIVKYAKDNLPLSSRGKFIVVVSNAKTQKDLAKAFFGIDNEIESLTKKEIISNLKSSIERITDSKSIAIDIKKRILDMFRGIDLTKRNQSTIDSLNATKRYIDIKKAEGEDVAMPERILKKLQILAMKPASEMSIIELAALNEDILFLEKLGKTKQKSREENYQYEKEERERELLSNVEKIHIKIPEKASPGETLSIWKKFSNKLQTILNVLKEKHLVIKPMDGIAEIMNMEKFKERHDINFSIFLEAIQTHLEERKNIVDKYNLNDKNMERAGIVALSKQEGGIDKLANNGLTEEKINELEASLTEGEKAFMAFVRKEFDEIYPLIKEFARVNYNIDVGHIDNYVSFITDFEAMTDIPVQERFGELAVNAIALRKNVDKDFIKNRIGTGDQKILINLDDIYLRHMNDALYMIHMGEDIKMDAEILRSPEAVEKMGNFGQLIWSEWIDLMARGGKSQANTIPLIDFLRGNATGAILAYRLSSALLQTTAIVNGMSEIGAQYGINGSSKIAFSREWRQFIKDNFPEIMATIGDDPAFIDLGEGWFSKVTKAGITPLVKLDMAARSSVAIGAYIRELDRQGIEVDLSKPNKEAIIVAQKIVRKTQGSSLVKDQPAGITSGALTSRGISLASGKPTLIGNKSIDKMITALQSFVFSNWDNIESTIWRQGIKKGDYKKASSGILWLLIIAPLAEMGIRDASKWIIGLLTGTDEEDKEEKEILERLIREDIGRIPFVGQIMNSINYGSNPIPAIQTSEKILSGFQKISSGKEDETKLRGAMDVASGVGALGFGAPTQIFDITKKLLDSSGIDEFIDFGSMDFGDENDDDNMDFGSMDFGSK